MMKARRVEDYRVDMSWTNELGKEVEFSDGGIDFEEIEEVVKNFEEQCKKENWKPNYMVFTPEIYYTWD